MKISSLFSKKKSSETKNQPVTNLVPNTNLYSSSSAFKNYYNDLISISNKDLADFAIENILKLLDATIDNNGRLNFLQGGYIDKLIRSESVKLKMIDYFMSGLGLGTSYSELTKDITKLFKNENQPVNEIEDTLETYLFDLFSGIHSAYNYAQAMAYGLNHFVYEGTLINDSREFCKENCGKVFSIKDLERFEKLNWAGKNPNVPFVISCGGYNCRHILRWIPETAVAFLEK